MIAREKTFLVGIQAFQVTYGVQCIHFVQSLILITLEDVLSGCKLHTASMYRRDNDFFIIYALP